jgi:c(7)-type cytochrome triheme protein
VTKRRPDGRERENEMERSQGDCGMKGKHRVIIVILLGVALVAFTGPAVHAQSDQMKLNHPEAFGRKQRPPVVFPHNRHVEANLSCKDCHHRYEEGKNVLDEGELAEGKPGIRCSECHDSKSRPRLREAFHDQCIGCHATKKGPRLCGECHVKK